MKISRKQLIIILSALLVIVCVFLLVMVLGSLKNSSNHDQTTTVETVPAKPIPTPSPTPVPLPPGKPRLDRVEMVTDQAFGDGNTYVPNGWGVQKLRIIRMTTGDIFTVYISEGSGLNDRTWHLMHRPPAGGWTEIKSGDAGAEPVNIVRGLNDEIHLFTWPGAQGKLDHFESTDMGKTWTSTMLPGKWIVDQGYGGAAINDKGDLIVFQTGADKPGQFFWTYYTPQTNQWQFNQIQIDYRCTYAFFFPGNNNDLTITCMRDVKRAEIGYPPAGGDFDYVFDESEYFYIPNLSSPQATQLVVKKVPPQSDQDYDLTYASDSYMDTTGRTHILYNNLYDGPHEAIIQNGSVVKDVQLSMINQTSGNKVRMTQDAAGRFYLIWIDDHGRLYVAPGAASDTDGTQFETTVKLNISQDSGCTNDDFCMIPTFTVPRGGNPRLNYIDGVYGNFTKMYYFRVNLRGTNEGQTLVTPTSPASPAPTSTLASVLAPLQNLLPAFVADEKRR